MVFESWLHEMAVVPHTAAEWGDIGARMSDLARQHGDARVQLTFFDEHRPLDAVATVGATGTRLRLASGSGPEQWVNSTLAGRLASCRAPQAPIFETQVLLPIVGTARGLGAWRGPIVAGRVRLGAGRANTVTDAQRRSARLCSQTVKSLSCCSALESNTAVFGGPPAEGRGAVPARGVHISERAARRSPTHACPRMAEIHGHIRCVV
ncbi:surface protease GP63, putative [Trypanosoma cruzi]|nr:surface protease GP63, putative [Trypanosoma cruzi]